MQDQLTWLHISDIHFQSKTGWRDRTVTKGLIAFLRHSFDKDPSLKPDLIFCTGDLAFGELSDSPIVDQYIQAEGFFDELLAISGKEGFPLAKNRLFVVPGNHDVNRKSVDEYVQKLFSGWADNAHVRIQEINQKFDSKSEEFLRIFKRQKEYGDFIEKYLPHQYDKDGRAFYAKTISIHGLKIGIAGFNSAWLCSGPENEDRKIWVAAQWQLNQAWHILEDATIRIGLMHHPIDWVNAAERSVLAKRISTDFHFWLHGHAHEMWVLPAQSHVVVGAGAVGAEGTDEFGANIVRLDLKRATGTVELFGHDSGGRSWKRMSFEVHAPDGRWPFTLPGSLAETVAVNRVEATNPLRDFDGMERDAPPEDICSDQTFLELVSSYSETLPDDFRDSKAREIFVYAWDKLAFNLYFANTLQTQLRGRTDALANVLLPICKISTGEVPTREELDLFFRKLIDIQRGLSSEMGQPIALLQMRMIRCTLYEGDHAINCHSVSDVFDQLHLVSMDFVDKFCVDLSLRHLCKYIKIPKSLLSRIDLSKNRFLLQNSEGSLQKVYSILVDPLTAANGKQLKNSLDRIRDAVGACKDAIDARWTVAAWLRVNALMESDEKASDFGEGLRNIIDSIQPSIIQKSSLLQSIYLNSLIRSYLAFGDLQHLQNFESRFIRQHDSIHLSQLIQLQLEFASSLYLACQRNDVDSIELLTITSLLRGGRQPCEHALFKNIFIENVPTLRLQFSPEVNIRKSTFHWLAAYITKLATLFAKPLLQRNHLRARWFKAASQIFHIHSILSGAVLSSLVQKSTNLVEYGSDSCAFSTDTFALVAGNQNLALLKTYILEALNADQYAVKRHALPISRTIYRLHYYGGSLDDDLLRDCAKKFFKITDMGVDEPKLFWIYGGAYRCKEVAAEREFLAEISTHFEKIAPKAYQLALRRGEEVVLTFPEEIIATARKYCGLSIIAAALPSNLIDAEVWNCLGTTVLNLDPARGADSLKQAADFYTAAKCFARGSRANDQKYCFNYIRCKSEITKIERKCPPDYFVRDTLYYLDRPEAAQFNFHNECLEPFFEVLKIHWHSVSEDARTRAVTLIDRRQWIRRSCPTANELRTLSPNSPTR
jgi:predicted MPP superfamily phosphohydrolase